VMHNWKRREVAHRRFKTRRAVIFRSLLVPRSTLRDNLIPGYKRPFTTIVIALQAIFSDRGRCAATSSRHLSRSSNLPAHSVRKALKNLLTADHNITLTLSQLVRSVSLRLFEPQRRSRPLALQKKCSVVFLKQLFFKGRRCCFFALITRIRSFFVVGVNDFG
jgi:hypothetical protein